MFSLRFTVLLFMKIPFRLENGFSKHWEYFCNGRIQLKCHCISSLPSKQIQTECLFDDPQPFFHPQNQKHNNDFFFLFTFALFFLAESQTLLNVLRWCSVSMKFNERANYSSLLIFAGLCNALAIPLRSQQPFLFHPSMLTCYVNSSYVRTNISPFTRFSE